MGKRDQTFDPLRSLTRLAIGGTLLAYDELQRQLRIWEQEANSELTRQQRAQKEQYHQVAQPDSAFHDAHDAPDSHDPRSRTTGTAPAMPQLPAAETPADTLRYALVGLLFEAPQRMAIESARLRQIDRVVGGLAAPLLDTLNKHHIFDPLLRQFDILTARGEAEVRRWVATGRAEEYHSRKLANIALQMGTEATANYVVEHSEVPDLIQEQGAGLADEVVEEMREHAVTVDTFLERLIRRRLGRKPREELPEPPEKLRAHATGVRKAENGSSKSRG